MSLLVTCLYDLKAREPNHQRRDIDYYLPYAQFLIHLQQPLIVFTEPHLERRLRQLFWLHSRIQVVVCPWNQLAYVERTAEIQRNHSLHPYRTRTPQKDTPVYWIVMWNKFEFILRAQRLQPQYTSYVWIDFGLEPVVKPLWDRTQSQWTSILNRFDADHLCCTVMNPLSAEEFERPERAFEGWRYRVVGGFWAMGRNVVERLVDAVRKDIQWLFDIQYIGVDEDLLARLVYQYPQHCRLSFGDYKSCILNWAGPFADCEYVMAVCEKLQDSSHHTCALDGFNLLLHGFAYHFLPLALPSLWPMLLRYHRSLQVVEPPKARKVALFLRQLLPRVPYFQEQWESHTDPAQQQQLADVDTEFRPWPCLEALEKRLVSESPLLQDIFYHDYLYNVAVV